MLYTVTDAEFMNVKIEVSGDNLESSPGETWVGIAQPNPLVGRYTQPLKPARLEHHPAALGLSPILSWGDVNFWTKLSLPTLLINWLGCQSKHSNDLFGVSGKRSKMSMPRFEPKTSDLKADTTCNPLDHRGKYFH
jgi:hypothetical protein